MVISNNSPDQDEALHKAAVALGRVIYELSMIWNEPRAVQVLTKMLVIMALDRAPTVITAMGLINVAVSEAMYQWEEDHPPKYSGTLFAIDPANIQQSLSEIESSEIPNEVKAAMKQMIQEISHKKRGEGKDEKEEK